MKTSITTFLAATFLSVSSSIVAEPYEDALRATVRITNGKASGTGFFVVTGDKSDPERQHLLITAAHVLRDMAGDTCTIIFRAQAEGGEFVRKEVALTIQKDKKPLWEQHKELDVAVIAMNLPEGLDIKPFKDSQIAAVRFAEEGKVKVGQNICIPCFPANLEANPAGWPILRRGSIASHPLIPLSGAKTFFVDSFSFGGESGAPVVLWVKDKAYVVGLITSMQRQTDKTKMPFEERTVHTPLGLGIAVQSPFIRQVIEQWQNKSAK